MNSDSQALYILVITGGIFAITAMLMYIFPPKRINFLYGYRTASSMKSEESWKFAQRYSAIAMLQSGLGLLFISGLVTFSPFSETSNTVISWIALIAAIAFMFVRTEKAIKTKFPV